jgi:hypothetical protein
MEGDQMMDQQQEARTLTLGERMVLAARLAVVEHLRQSINEVPRSSFELYKSERSNRTAKSNAVPALAAGASAWSTP